MGRETSCVTLPQQVYVHLYNARSKFVHGDEVSTELLLPFGEGAPPLLSLASTIYRTALMAYLEEHWPQESTQRLASDESSLTAYFKNAWQNSPYEDHLLAAIGKSYRN